MRFPALALLLCLAAPALAQKAPPPLEPLPEPPPPPPGIEGEAVPEPQVTIIRRGEDLVEEFRINGRLYKIKVTPPHGVPYYLVDYKGDGTFSRLDNLDEGVRVPMWVLFEF